MSTDSSKNQISVSRIPSLNGIRALSVLLVFFSHAGLGHILPGGFGVTVFFFLSGYLITTLLLNENETNNRISIRYFYIRRFLRLSPSLFITLIIAYALTYLSVSPGGVSLNGALAQLLYFTNYYSIYFNHSGKIPEGTGILWSLAVEEHYYILYPILTVIILKRFNARKFVLLLASLCIAVLLWRFILVLGFSVDDARTYYATDTRIDSIIFGCLLAMTYNPVKKYSVDHSLKTHDYMIILIAIILLLISFLYRDPFFRETSRYSLQGLALMPLFYYSISKHKHKIFAWLNHSYLERIGIYSYSIYLIHHFVLNSFLFQSTDKSYSIGIILASLSVTIAYAFMIDQFIDKPMLKIRKRYRLTRESTLKE